MPTINVLTPVKNEEWILKLFLEATSLFADNILIADQNSTDNSLNIARCFPKVTIIDNNSESFNESSRQVLLIETARKLFGTDSILLALDADEIISADSLHSKEWDLIRSSPPGTVLYFEKPTFYNGVYNVIRYKNFGGWPLGYVDDGAPHNPKYIHSNRLPFKEDSPKLYLSDIKFLHCNLLSITRQRSKVRYYCLLETLVKSKSWYHRISYYNRHYSYITEEGDGLEEANPAWVDEWMEKKLNLVNTSSNTYYWYDEEALKLFKKHGSRRFWMEDVWDFNWEAAKNHFRLNGFTVTPPPSIVSAFRDLLYYMLRYMFAIKRSYKKVIRS